MSPVGEKKGLPALAWAGIGCGGLVLIGVVVAVVMFVSSAAHFGKKMLESLDEHPGKTAAAAVLAERPELIQKVSEDRKTGELVLRFSTSEEEIRTNYDDIVMGVELKDSLGKPLFANSGDPAKLPSWLSRYPGATEETMLIQKDDAVSSHGVLAFHTTDAPTAVVVFYEREWDKLSSGGASTRSSMNLNGTESQTFEVSEGKYRLKVDAYRKPGKPAIVQVIYGEKK